MKCYYCSIELNDKNWTKDHKLARSLGGLDVITNMVDCCFNCNNNKAILEGHLAQLYYGLRARKSKTYHNQFYREYRKRSLDFYIRIWIQLFREYNSIINIAFFEHLLYEKEIKDIICALSTAQIPFTRI